MSIKRLVGVAAAASVTALSGVPAGADNAPCALTYEVFESAVAHLDIDHCPDKSFKDQAFCRVVVGGNQAHVFYFSSNDGQCLLKVESFNDDELDLKFKR